MAYQPAGAVPCVPGKRYHCWSVSRAMGLGARRAVEWQSCQRCGCMRERVIDGARPTMGRGWQYNAGRKGGDRG